MDKKKITLATPNYEPYDHALPVGDAVVNVRLRIPRLEKERAAAEMVASSIIMDDTLGICHKAINAEVAHLITALRHYTDLDMEAYGTDDGMYALYDMFKAESAYDAFYALIEADWREITHIYEILYEIAASVFTREHSLEHRLTGFLEDFLAVGDLADTLSQAKEINDTLVDAFGALKAQQTTGGKIGGNVISFAKKEPLGRDNGDE